MGALPDKINEISRQNRLHIEGQLRVLEGMNHRPRVLHLVTSFEAGGTERQFVELLKRLDRERYDVRLAALRREGDFYEEIRGDYPEVPEFRLTSFYNRNAFRQLGKLRELLRRERIDILHTHGFYDSFFGAVAGRLSGVKVIASQRHLKLSDRRAHDWGTRAIHRLAHRIVVNSEAIRDSILASDGDAAEKIVVIRNGLLPATVDSLQGNDSPIPPGLSLEDGECQKRRSRNALVAELGLFPTMKIIGMVARLVAVKGHRYFIEAAARLLREDPRLHFVLIGDGPLKSEIEQQALRLGIRERLHLLGERKDARRLVSCFDVSVLTSLSEGLPNTVMEAMSAGVPVVATAVGGTTELISNSVTGYLIPPADVEALTERILYVLRNEEESQAVAERGREFITNRFSMRRMVDAVEGLYEELMTVRKTSSAG